MHPLDSAAGRRAPYRPGRALCVIGAALLAVACTTLEPAIGTQPDEGYDLVDSSKTDMAQYAKDYEACAAIANQNPSSASHVATRTVGTVADRATFGLIGQKAAKDGDRRSVLKRCLTGRGYNVLR